MKLFISWSGDRSKTLSQALRDWIPLVLQYAEPWVSDVDIEAGERWAEAIAKQLEACNYGVVCLTPENIASAWVLFEAGALAKYMQTSRVTPLLLDLEVRNLTGPLTQFQAKKLDQAGLTDLIHSINKVAPQPILEQRATQLVEALWPQLEKRVAAIPKSAVPTKHSRPQTEILEELVASVRSLESRFREVGEDFPRSSRHRRRLHPFMVQDFARMVADGPRDPTMLLLVASLFRDEVPWLYELGYEAYRAAKYGASDEAVAAFRRFQRAAEVLQRGPFPAEEMGVDPRAVHMVLRELEQFLGGEPEPPHEPQALSKPKHEKRPDKSKQGGPA